MSYKFTAKLTIITVVKDDYAGFVRTANSLLNQKRLDFEWLVVDSSSTEDISFFLKRLPFGTKAITYIRQPANGIYSAMNLGLKEASGAFIWYLNAGDLLSSETSVDLALSQLKNGVDAVAFPVIHITQEGCIYAISIPTIFQKQEGASVAIVNHQGVIVSKEVMVSVGGFDESLSLAADGKLLDAIANRYIMKLVHTVIVAFSYGGASTKSFDGVLAEIGTYRTPLSRYSRILLLLKSKLRYVIFKREKDPIFGSLIRFGLRYRQNLILKSHSSVEFKLDLL